MSAQFRQQASGSPAGSGSGPYTLAYPNQQAAGNFNFVVIAWGDATRTISAITDSNSQTYVLVSANDSYATGVNRQSIYYVSNIAADTSTPNVLSVTFSGTPTTPHFAIAEYNAVAGSSALDGTNASISDGNSTSLTATSTTTSTSLSLVVGGFSTKASKTLTATGSTTLRTAATGFAFIVDKNVTTTATQVASGTIASGYWIARTANFKAVASVDIGPSVINCLSTGTFALPSNKTTLLFRPIVSAISNSNCSTHGSALVQAYSRTGALYTPTIAVPVVPIEISGGVNGVSSSTSVFIIRLVNLSIYATSTSSSVWHFRLVDLPVTCIALSSSVWNFRLAHIDSAEISSSNTAVTVRRYARPGLIGVSNSSYTNNWKTIRIVLGLASVSNGIFNTWPKVYPRWSGLGVEADSFAIFNYRLRAVLTATALSNVNLNLKPRFILGSVFPPNLRPIASSISVIKVSFSALRPHLIASSVSSVSLVFRLANLPIDGISSSSSPISSVTRLIRSKLIAIASSISGLTSNSTYLLQTFPSVSYVSINATLINANFIRVFPRCISLSDASVKVEFPNLLELKLVAGSASSLSYTFEKEYLGVIQMISGSNASFTFDKSHLRIQVPAVSLSTVLNNPPDRIFRGIVSILSASVSTAKRTMLPFANNPASALSNDSTVTRRVFRATQSQSLSASGLSTVQFTRFIRRNLVANSNSDSVFNITVSVCRPGLIATELSNALINAETIFYFKSPIYFNSISTSVVSLANSRLINLGYQFNASGNTKASFSYSEITVFVEPKLYPSSTSNASILIHLSGIERISVSCVSNSSASVSSHNVDTVIQLISVSSSVTGAAFHLSSPKYSFPKVTCISNSYAYDNILHPGLNTSSISNTLVKFSIINVFESVPFSPLSSSGALFNVWGIYGHREVFVYSTSNSNAASRQRCISHYTLSAQSSSNSVFNCALINTFITISAKSGSRAMFDFGGVQITHKSVQLYANSVSSAPVTVSAIRIVHATSEVSVSSALFHVTLFNQYLRTPISIVSVGNAFIRFSSRGLLDITLSSVKASSTCAISIHYAVEPVFNILSYSNTALNYQIIQRLPFVSAVELSTASITFTRIRSPKLIATSTSKFVMLEKPNLYRLILNAQSISNCSVINHGTCFAITQAISNSACGISPDAFQEIFSYAESFSGSIFSFSYDYATIAECESISDCSINGSYIQTLKGGGNRSKVQVIRIKAKKPIKITVP